MGKALYLILRIVCYLALALIAGSIVALMVVGTFGNCAQGGESFDCASPFMQGLGNAANIVMLTSVFTGLPMLLALGGIFFLIRSGFRSFRKDSAK